jgi:hypothetical protein
MTPRRPPATYVDSAGITPWTGQAGGAVGPHRQLDARSITTTATSMARERWGLERLRCVTWCCV